MSEEAKNQISKWLKKLEQESWQLELLVSAFTIFLLIQAIGSFSEFRIGLQYEYNLGDSLLAFIFFFISLVGMSIKALVMFLILHLLLRGFWIGTIGLRSVQSVIDFEKLNYSDYFTEKLKKKVISLDSLVVMLDEICSLIFSFAFLIISILLAFGLYILFLGVIAISLGAIANLTSGTLELIITIINVLIILTILITGLIYLIDYFTLGFFKKFKWFSKLYYPFYRFYGTITLAVISRSIYYYLISRFSKRKIRMVYLIAGALLSLSYLLDYDQYQYYPAEDDRYEVIPNQYDNLRPIQKHVRGASIQSNVLSGDFVQLFIRYNPKDNSKIQSVCPEIIPEKEEGFNWRFKVVTQDMRFFISPQNFDEDDKAKLLECQSQIYQISINDSIYNDLTYNFYKHPAKNQKGIITFISTSNLRKGQNILQIRQRFMDEDNELQTEDYTRIPFWFH